MAGSIVVMYFKLMNIENKWEIVKKHCTNKHQTPLGVGGGSPHRPSWCYYRSDLILPSYKYKPLSSIDHPFSPAQCKQNKGFGTLLKFWSCFISPFSVKKNFKFQSIRYEFHIKYWLNRKNLNDQMRGWFSEFCVGIFDLIAHNYFVQKHTLLW